MFGKEPAVFFNGIGEIIRAIVPCLILFGVIQWTDEQIAGVFLAVGVVLGFLTTMLTRSQTTPTETVNTLVETAVKMPADSTVEDVKAEANV